MALQQIIDAAPVIGETDDSITKIISSADAIMALPSPRNVHRARENIIDIPVTLILSKSGKTPQRIVDLIRVSKSQEILADSDNILLGLCINGRKLPLEIYLHKGLFDKKYSSNNDILENVFWHEFIHGNEGVYVTVEGVIQRKTPWSFTFQKRLQQLDQLSGNPFDGSKYGNRKFANFVDYLHNGTDLQDHVSELFARMGGLMLHHVRVSGEIPRTDKDLYAFLDSYGLIKLPTPTAESQPEAADIWLAVVTHQKKAQSAFWRYAPKIISRAARLYGCESLK